MQFIFGDYVRRALIAVSDEIDEYQVIQQAPDQVLVRLLVRDERQTERLANGVQDALRNVFDSYDCHLPKVEVRFEPPLPNPSSGKLIRVQRAFQV
jgi:hypothetical protein